MTVITRILVPFDFGDPSAHAREYAKEFAVRFDPSLDLLHVVPDPYVAETVSMYMRMVPDFLDGLVNGAARRLDDVLPTADRTRLRARSIVKVGDRGIEILNYAHAEQVNLIVMGTHGRSGIAHVALGSVAERVVRAASGPVLTVARQRR
jgi:nucleotide-binding universal stress UspA family protein